MLEKKVEDAIANVAEQVSVPANLYPSAIQVAQARTARQRMRTLVVVLTVALTATVSFSPAREAIAQAISTLVMTRQLRYVSSEEYAEIKARVAEDPMPQSLIMKSQTIPMGETISQTYVWKTYNRDVYETATALTLADVLRPDSSWTIPTYLSPLTDTRVVLYKYSTRQGQEPYKLRYTMLFFSYKVDLNGVSHNVTVMDSHYEFTSSKVVPSTVSVFPDHPREVKQITIAGQPATAVKSGPLWSVTAQYAKGSFSVTTDLPIPELEKLMESMIEQANLHPELLQLTPPAPK